MIKRFIAALHIGSSDVCYHWSETSQMYATATILLKYLHQDWQLAPQVVVESFSCYGGRHVDIFYFTLTKNGQQIELPVLSNPVVRRLIAYCKFQVVSAVAQTTDLCTAEDTPPPLSEAVKAAEPVTVARTAKTAEIAWY